MADGDVTDGRNRQPQALTLRADGLTTPLRFVRASPTDPADAAWAWEFAGVFRSDEVEMTYETMTDDDRLIPRSLKMSQTMLPVEPDPFASDDCRLRFRRDASGQVAGFALNSDRIGDFRLARVAR
jgi:hypothetical protein